MQVQERTDLLKQRLDEMPDERTARLKIDCQKNPGLSICQPGAGLELMGPVGMVVKPGVGLVSRLLGWLFGRGAATGGVTAAETLARGLVSSSGKLGQLLPAIESQFGAAAPKNALQALNVVGQATKSVGLESGYVISQEGGKIVLQNVGGVITTLGSEGSILVQRGSDVLLHLIP
jgi:hypothetical protein